MANVKFNAENRQHQTESVDAGMLFRGTGSHNDVLYLVIRTFGELRLADVSDGQLLSGDVEYDNISQVQENKNLVYLPNATIIVE